MKIHIDKLKSPSRAWALGVGLLIVESVGLGLSLTFDIFTPVTKTVWHWLVPVSAAFLVSSLSPRHKILLGLSLVLARAVIIVATSMICESLGIRTDFPTLKSAVALFLLLLLLGNVQCLVGTLMGYLWSTRGSQPA